MKMVFAYPEALGWLEDRMGYSFNRNARGLLAVDEMGRIRGGVAWDHWTTTSCEMHQVFTTPIAMRVLLKEAFRYPFVKAEKKTIFGRTPENLPDALHSAMHFGFQEEARLKDGYDEGVDMIILRLDRRDCRFLEDS